MAREVSEGRLKRGLPYLSLGEGPPLAVFPGLGLTNANPTDVQRFGEVAAAISPGTRLHHAQDKPQGRDRARHDDGRPR
jgi:hypothetical protein